MFQPIKKYPHLLFLLAVVLSCFTPTASGSASPPSHYTGTLPCADCSGIETHLELHDDGTYILKEHYIDRDTDGEYETGRWLLSSDKQILVLYGSQQTPLSYFTLLRNGKTLERRDINGQPILSSLNYRLEKRDSSITPLKPRLSLTGFFNLYDGQPTYFTECTTGKTRQVLKTGAYENTVQAHLERQRLSVTMPLSFITNIRAHIENDAQLTIEAFEGFKDEPLACPPPVANHPLKVTQWQLIQLEEQNITDQNASAPYLIFDASGRLSGSAGCNQIIATYGITDNQLHISMPATTRMACTQGMALENAFLKALEAIHTWRVIGIYLYLYDKEKQFLGRFKAKNTTDSKRSALETPPSVK